MKGMFLFQRDLRLTDQRGLTEALTGCDEILLAAVFDPELHKLPLLVTEEGQSPKFCFNTQERLSSLIALEDELLEMGKPLAVHVGPLVPWILELCLAYGIERVWLNQVNEPKSLLAYHELERQLKSIGCILVCCEDDYGVPLDQIRKEDGSIYKVFTPFYKKWRSLLSLESLSPFTPDWQSPSVYISVENKNYTWYKLREKVLNPLNGSTPKNEQDYQGQWANFLSEKIQTYEKDRDYPAVEGTSQMSLAINNGRISYRQLVRETFWHPQGEAFLRQLAWRQFYQMILLHFPEVETEAFRREYRTLVWPNDPELFQKWKDGETGFAIVDAAMKQLKTEGLMHNRLRMVCASLLVKHLGVDWRLGEAYFYEMLRDGDLALNNGGWQWCASTGTDAQPYFRIFNPLRQAERYDPDRVYIHRWITSFTAPCVDLKSKSSWTVQLYKNAKERALADE